MIPRGPGRCIVERADSRRNESGDFALRMAREWPDSPALRSCSFPRVGSPRLCPGPARRPCGFSVFGCERSGHTLPLEERVPLRCSIQSCMTSTVGEFLTFVSVSENDAGQIARRFFLADWAAFGSSEP